MIIKEKEVFFFKKKKHEKTSIQPHFLTIEANQANCSPETKAKTNSNQTKRKKPRYTGRDVIEGDASAGEGLLDSSRDVTSISISPDGNRALVVHLRQPRSNVLSDEVWIASSGNLTVLDIPPHRRLRLRILSVGHLLLLLFLLRHRMPGFADRSLKT